MSLFTYLLRRSMKPLRTPQKPLTPKAKGKLPIIKTGKRPGIVRGVVKKKASLSSPGGEFIASLIGSTTPGAKKMQFPFDKIPPIDVNVALEKSTRNTILSLGGMLVGGMLVGSLLKSRLKTS